MGEEEKIERLLGTFYRATQIGAIFFDCKMNVTFCRFQEHMYADFLRISMGKVETFLKDVFAKESGASKSFYTYYLNYNFVCNISLFTEGNTCRGAAVTQPFSLNACKSSDIEAKPEGVAQTSIERSAYVSALLRAPVVPHDRIIPIGEVLSLLSQSVLAPDRFHQVVCGGETDPILYQLLQPGKQFHQKQKTLSDDRHCGHATYLKIKDAISKGNTEALLEAFGTINDKNIQMDQHASKDIVRSIKNRLIEGCAMCSFFAIEAGVSYDKTRGFSEQIISELEGTENVSDMYALVKSGLKTLTRYAASTRISGYSKHVRLAVEYIEQHYAEKITLERLAKETNLSKFYLSGIIKKETGSSVTDIINRVRMEESKKILLKSTISIAELSSKVGYAYSNHFSKVFKQHTGMTPSEYAKAIASSSGEDARSKDILRALADQLCQAMESFPGVFDLGRIVDPDLNIAWGMQPSGKVDEDICYHCWNRKQSCETCVSRMALDQGRAFVKLDQGAGKSIFRFCDAGGHRREEICAGTIKKR